MSYLKNKKSIVSNMETKNQTVSKTAEREISITRILNAPKELVFEAWTDPKHISEWWGPIGFTTTVREMDLRPGGKWLQTMHGPDGKDYPDEMIFTTVVKPDLIKYTHTAPKFDATVTFEAVGNKTKLTMSMVFDNVEEYNFVVKEHGAVEGQVQTINRFEKLLSKMSVGKELVITRTFNAPRKLVYKAFSEADALAQWWEPKGSTIEVKKFDFRPNGMFHYKVESPHGVMWVLFVYLEMVEPERIVFINSFSDEKGNIATNPFLPKFPKEILDIFTFEEHEGKTTLTLRGGPINATAEEYKAYTDMFSNMQQGYKGTWELLEEYLAKAN
jgi:uncharacterized protein YndB with AHSA1/START domain